VLGFGLALPAPAVASAATFTVNTTKDTLTAGACAAGTANQWSTSRPAAMSPGARVPVCS
jgi:hypothetical protein